ncbi:MAG: hypothetical protein IPO73_14920 [Gemmatimonadetes bacterium]|nr:hypothetical protein [Gemmatimonadota bacterium]
MASGIGAGCAGPFPVRVITTPVSKKPFTSMEPISGNSCSSSASLRTSLSSTDLMPGTFPISRARSCVSLVFMSRQVAGGR